MTYGHDDSTINIVMGIIIIIIQHFCPTVTLIMPYKRSLGC